MDKNRTIELTELDGNNNGKYKVEVIWNSAVYAKESESGQVLGFYYLVSWKGYSEKEKYLEAYIGRSISQEAHQLVP